MTLESSGEKIDRQVEISNKIDELSSAIEKLEL